MFWRNTQFPSKGYTRKFLAAEASLRDPLVLESYIEKLLSMELASENDLVQFLEKYNELVSAISEESARLYIDMTCQTDDEEKSKAYIQYIETIQPKWEKWQKDLHKKVHACPFKQKLDPSLYTVWLKSIDTQIRLFREANIPIQTKISLLSQKYQETIGGLSAEWEGVETTLSRIEKNLEETNRDTREKAWRTIANKRLEKAEELNNLFFEMMELRLQIAKNSGFDNYLDYTFTIMERTDYTPAECVAYHQTVKQYVVPLYQKILEHKKKKLGLDHLRPWDLNCDSSRRAPLKPFQTTEDFMQKCSQVFAKISPEFQDFFLQMKNQNLLDLENRKGKAPGGYQCGLDEIHMPFIFMNAVGSHKDIMTLFHEGGHSFHEFYTSKLPFSEVRHAPMEFCEVASMSMEQFALNYLSDFYTSEEQKRAQASEKEEELRLLIWVAIVDSFQHFLYTEKNLTPQKLIEHWTLLNKTYFPALDYSGLDKELGHSWHRQLHIFEYPFYYIEYGIAQLGALQFGKKYLEDPTQALDLYKKALKLGGTASLKKLFQTGELQFSLEPELIKKLSFHVYEDWERLSV